MDAPGLLRPGAQGPPDRDQLPEVIRVVVRDQQSLTQERLPITPGKRCEQILAGLFPGIILTLLFIGLVTYPLNVIWGHALIPVEIAILGESVIFLVIYFFPYKYSIRKVWN